MDISFSESAKQRTSCAFPDAVQAEAMTSHYRLPVLLIEFDHDKAFALQVCLQIPSSLKPLWHPPCEAACRSSCLLVLRTQVPCKYCEFTTTVLSLPACTALMTTLNP